MKNIINLKVSSFLYLNTTKNVRLFGSFLLACQMHGVFVRAHNLRLLRNPRIERPCNCAAHVSGWVKHATNIFHLLVSNRRLNKSPHSRRGSTVSLSRSRRGSASGTDTPMLGYKEQSLLINFNFQICFSTPSILLELLKNCNFRPLHRGLPQRHRARNWTIPLRTTVIICFHNFYQSQCICYVSRIY